MKTVHFASILVLTVATAFACNDDGDRVNGGNAGSAGKNAAAGSAGKNAGAGTSNGAGAGGGDGGSANEGGVGGIAGATNDGDAAGAGGANEGGAAGGGAGGASEGGAAFGGAGGEGGAGVPSALEILGTWNNNYGGTEIITETAWGASALAAYDNGTNVVYTQFPASDQYNPNKFAKIVYTEVQNDSFYFCMVVYSADTLEAARADVTVPDATDPATTGCGGTFAWTKATRQ